MFAPTVLSICIRRFGDTRWVACFLLLDNHTHINGYILNNRSKVRTSVLPIPMYSCVLCINYTKLDIRILHTLMYQIDLCYTDKNIHKEYLPGSYVLVHNRAGLPPTRLHTNWKGLMRVIKGLNSRYTLLDLIIGKEKDYLVSDMKPFVCYSALVDLLDIARRDQMEFFIEKISDHRGKLSQRKSHQLFVSWMGYDQSYDSWEPYANLRDSDQLHSYLREKSSRIQ